jgi:predicted lipase
VVLTGHSLGGALAQLAAVSIAASSAAEGRPIRPLLVTFASPAVGDGGFARELRAAAEPCGGLRVYNSADPIPHMCVTGVTASRASRAPWQALPPTRGAHAAGDA